MGTHTQTHVDLALSTGTFLEIRDKLRAAGYDHLFVASDEGLTIDLGTISIVEEGDSETKDWPLSAIEQLLIREEGERLSVYRDSKGLWTIGIGRLVDKMAGGCVTQAESRLMLKRDVHVREKALRERLPWFDTLSDVRQMVLLAMSFQMGVAGLLVFKRTLRLIEAGEWSAAADAMLDSKWAREDSPQRARRMAEAMRTGAMGV